MAKILSGKQVAEAMTAKVRARADHLSGQGLVPKLVIVRLGEDPSDLAYERGALKRAEAAGVLAERIVLGEETSKEELTGTLRRLSGDETVHGVLLFRPLPAHLKAAEREIVNALDPAKDVDGMTSLSCAGVYEGAPLGFPPCTAQAVIEMLDYYDIQLKGTRAAVIGRSLVIGRPVAMLLMARNATVTICHTRTKDVPAVTREADLIVTAAGKLGMLNAAYVREGQTVIDVSVNYDPEKNDGNGGFAGDAVFDEVEPAAAAITPVPGGVGAVTTSVLMEHVVRSAERTAARCGLQPYATEDE